MKRVAESFPERTYSKKDRRGEQLDAFTLRGLISRRPSGVWSTTLTMSLYPRDGDTHGEYPMTQNVISWGCGSRVVSRLLFNNRRRVESSIDDEKERGSSVKRRKSDDMPEFQITNCYR